MLAGGSIPNIGSGDAGPSFSRSNLGQLNYSAPFSVGGKGNQSPGGNATILALILVAGVVAVALVKR